MSERKKPIDFIAAKRKRNLGKKEIEPPEDLPENLKEEFKKIAKILDKIGIINDLNTTILGRFLVAEYQYQQVTTKMLKMKKITDEYIECSELQDLFFQQARLAADELGLTITSRCRLIFSSEY